MRSSQGILHAIIIVFALGVMTSAPTASQAQQEKIERQNQTYTDRNYLLTKSVEELSKEKTIAEIIKLREETATAQDKIWPTLVSTLGIFVPLLLGVATLHFQQMHATAMKQREIESNFKLKVADFVMSSTSPAMANGRLAIMNEMFRDVLGPDFQATVKRVGFPATRRTTVRDNLFQALGEKITNPKDILSVHKQIFPEESEWSEKINL